MSCHFALLYLCLFIYSHFLTDLWFCHARFLIPFLTFFPSYPVALHPLLLIRIASFTISLRLSLPLVSRFTFLAPPHTPFSPYSLSILVLLWVIFPTRRETDRYPCGFSHDVQRWSFFSRTPVPSVSRPHKNNIFFKKTKKQQKQQKMICLQAIV